MKLRRRKKLSRQLVEAILGADPSRVKALLRAGADPGQRDSEGTTPLYLAAVQGEAEIARLLMEAGASPDTESRGAGSDGTPLCAAACWGHTGAVRVLLAHGADPNLREDHGTGWSPWEWANHGPHPETVELLVSAGANPSDVDEAAVRLREAVRRIEDATRDRAATGRGPEEADDVVGTFATDGALGFDPFPFLRALYEAGSHAVVIGQVAGIMHGSQEPTGDLDLLWDGTPEQARALRTALTDAGCVDLPDLDRPQAAYRVTGASGDLCTPALPWGDMDVAPCLSRAVSTRAPAGFPVRYAALDDLIRMRRALGRPKDHRRADELERLRP